MQFITGSSPEYIDKFMTANNIPLMTAIALKQTLNLTSSQRHSVAIKVGFWDYSEFGRTWVAVTGLGLTKRRFKIKVCFSKLTVTCRSRKSRSDFTFAFNPPVLSQFQQLLFGSEFLGI